MSADMPNFTPQPWELIELAAPMGDLGSSFVIRGKEAPGGLALTIGGMGDSEERANAHLILTAPEMYAALERIFEREGWSWIGTILAKARGES